MSQQQACVITNVDSFLGYALAYRILEACQEEGSRHHQLRLLCRDRSGLEQLEKLGGQIICLDYRDEHKLKEAMHQVRAVMLIPEHSREMRQEGECVIRAAREANIEHMAIFSVIAADRASEGNIIHQMYQLEQKVKEQFRENHCVVRTPMFNQVFYYLWPEIENKNALALPVKEDCRWGAVNVRDVVEAVWKLAKEHQKDRGAFCGLLGSKKQLYEFTPQRNRNGKEIAREISEGMERKVEYRQIERHQLEQYLRGIRDDRRFRERPEEENRSNRGSVERDRPYSFPLGRFLNDQCINLFLEFWEMANRNQVDKVSNDLEEILGRKPIELRKYFESNRDQFRRLR